MTTVRTSAGLGQVLVCDADAAAAQAVASALDAAGFRASTCATAAACQEAVVAAPPALVTLPVLLPDLDGFALARWICGRRDAMGATPAPRGPKAPTGPNATATTDRAGAECAGAGDNLDADQRASATGAASAARADDRGPLLPRVVMISALQAAHEALGAGADAFLRKPVSPTDVVDLARELIGGEARPTLASPVETSEGNGTALAEVIARTARAVATVAQPEEAQAAVLAAVRTYLGASGALLLRCEQGLLLPATGRAQPSVPRALDEAGLVPAGGGGYPVGLGGWVEGVLVLTDVAPARLAAHEASIAPLLDLAAAALRHARLLEDVLRQNREREARAFAQLSDSSSAATARAFGHAPLRVAAPGVFGDLTQRYGEVLDLALEQQAFKVDHRLPDVLRTLAQQLGVLRAGPRDVIEVHSAALRAKTAQAPPRKAQAYTNEAHVIVLELMGYLAAFYRGRAWPGESRLSQAPAATSQVAGWPNGADGGLGRADRGAIEVSADRPRAPALPQTTQTP